MARYDSQHKEKTRSRILDAAGRRLKTDGIDGSGIATLMADAGLTNGAFYAHFTSKDDLVAHVVGQQLSAQRDVLAGLGVGIAEAEAFIRGYLSVEHRDQPAEGCPSAALLDELPRCGAQVRTSYTAGMKDIIETVSGVLDPIDPTAARSRALALLTSLFGTLQLARVLTDEELSIEVLDAGVRHALDLVDS